MNGYPIYEPKTCPTCGGPGGWDARTQSYRCHRCAQAAKTADYWNQRNQGRKP